MDQLSVHMLDVLHCHPIHGTSPTLQDLSLCLELPSRYCDRVYLRELSCHDSASSGCLHVYIHVGESWGWKLQAPNFTCLGNF